MMGRTGTVFQLMRASLCVLWLAACVAHASELLIAQVAPLSGPLARTGIDLRDGAQLYFDTVNAGGGINGAKLRLVSRDDGYQAAETVRQTMSLLRDMPTLALFGYVGTANVEALLKEQTLENAGIPLVTVRTGSPSLARFADPYLFITRASYGAEVHRMVDQLVSTGYRRIAVFYQDDVFGKEGLTQAEWAIRQANATLVASSPYEKNTVKVEVAIKTIAAASPHAVIMISNTAASAEFVKQFRAAGHKAQLIVLSETDGPEVAKLIGNAAASGLAVMQVVPDPNSHSAIAQEMQSSLKHFGAKGATLNHTMLEGYLGAKILVEGLRRAGVNPTRKKLQEALEGMKDFDASGLKVSFGAENNFGVQYLDITILNRAGRLLR